MYVASTATLARSLAALVTSVLRSGIGSLLGSDRGVGVGDPNTSVYGMINSCKHRRGRREVVTGCGGGGLLRAPPVRKTTSGLEDPYGTGGGRLASSP